MADDIDDLLDEVEKKFCPVNCTHTDEASVHTLNSNISKFTLKNIDAELKGFCDYDHAIIRENMENVKNSRENTTRTSDESSSEDSEDDLEDLIEDICSSSDEPILPTEVPYVPPPKHPYSSKPKKQCYPVYVGGSAHEHGTGTVSNKLTCNKLRCTRCDFKVTIFDDLKWDGAVDYLFLRNNVPDYNRLKPKLLGSKGSCAYCCQCMCRTYSDLGVLDDPSLPWVCGKHLIESASTNDTHS